MRYTPGRFGSPATNDLGSKDTAGGIEDDDLIIKRVEFRPFSERQKSISMAKVEAVGIRPGNLLEWDKRVWRVLKAYHVHVGGRGGAFMQVAMKDIDLGTKTNQRFRTDANIERAFVVEIPPSVILTVVDTEPGIKNATATNTFKPATMETGITVQVPPFINKGERIKVDTNEGTYMERA